MVEVGEVANYAEIIGAALVVGGLAFAVFELRQAREQREQEREDRRREAAFQVFQNFGTREFLSGIRILYDLPEGLSRRELEEQYGDDLEKIHWIMYQFENLGVMVYNRMMPIELAEEFVQVSILNSWVKLQSYIRELREQTNKPQLYAAVQWLAELVQHRDRDLTQTYSAPEAWEKARG